MKINWKAAKKSAFDVVMGFLFVAAIWFVIGVIILIPFLLAGNGYPILAAISILVMVSFGMFMIAYSQNKNDPDLQ